MTAKQYKLSPNALESSDDSQMYAVFNASVPEVDREEEVIFPMSFHTREWEQNPVWLWAHDQKALPIGAGYTADGAIACWKTDKALQLGCRFSQANPQGALTYALYKEKTLKMVSVGYMQKGRHRMEKKDAERFGFEGRPYLVIDPELIECSCVPVGMNRKAMIQSIKSIGRLADYADADAVAVLLDKGHLAGEKLPEDMREALKDFAAPRWKKMGIWSSKTKSNILAFGYKGRDSGMSTLAKPPLTAGTIPAETKAIPAPAPTPVVETKATAPNDEVIPMGAAILKGGMGHLAEFCKTMTESMETSDLPANRDFAKAMASKVAGLVKEMHEYGAANYKDHSVHFDEAYGAARLYETAEDEAEGHAEADDTPAPPQEEEGEVSKTAEEVVTLKQFNEWHNKEFGEQTAKEFIEAAVKEALSPVLVRLDEHHTVLELVNKVIAKARMY